VLTVDLSRNQLSPAAVESIHGLLKVNKVIRTFNISENAITEGSVLASVLIDTSISISALAFSRYQA
jgi:ribosomal protein L18E